MRAPLFAALVIGCLAGTSHAGEAPVIIDEHMQDCDERPAEWRLNGTVALAEVLREMSATFCDGYLVPKALLQRRVTLAIEPTTNLRELATRVEGSLAAHGIELKRAGVEVVTKVAPPPRRAPASPPALDLVDLRPQDCEETGDWKSVGRVELGAVLRQMSVQFCAGYFVTKELARQQVELVVERTADPREMQTRVEGALRAQGIDLDYASFYAVTLNEPAGPAKR